MEVKCDKNNRRAAAHFYYRSYHGERERRGVVERKMC